MATLIGKFTHELDFSAGREEWRRAEEDWLDNLKAELRSKKTGDLVGEELRWPRADGYARYMIVSQAPNLVLAHLEIGDAWQVEEALIRGLRLADAQQMVERDKAFAAMFRGKSL